jgi:hypothetical protein
MELSPVRSLSNDAVSTLGRLFTRPRRSGHGETQLKTSEVSDVVFACQEPIKRRSFDVGKAIR